MGVSSVGDLAALAPAAVLGALGRAHGQHLLDLAAGRDDRPVEVAREVKSIGHEETFAYDLHDIDDVRREVVRLADAVAARLRAAGTAGRTFTLKVRDPSFTTTTRAVTVAGAVDTAEAILAVVGPLLDDIDLAAGVRLLGLAASKFAAPAEQLRLEVFGGELVNARPGRWSDASTAVDGVRQRFGDAAIGPASSVATGPDGRRRVRLVRAGAQQWGPDHDGVPPVDAHSGDPHDGDDEFAR